MNVCGYFDVSKKIWVRLTSEFVLGQIDCAVATRAQFLLEEVVVFDVALSWLYEPSFIHFHDDLFDSLLWLLWFWLLHLDWFKIFVKISHTSSNLLS